MYLNTVTVTNWTTVEKPNACAELTNVNYKKNKTTNRKIKDGTIRLRSKQDFKMMCRPMVVKVWSRDPVVASWSVFFVCFFFTFLSSLITNKS